MNEPILIPCEGSRHSAHLYPSLGAHGICTMCGQIVPVYGDATAYPHDRDDLLTRIDRGDFDA